MKSLAISLCLATQLVGFATADFHIVEHQGSTQKYPVPSNKYSCSGIDYAVSQNADIQGAIGGSQMFMRYASNFCGVQGLDFYKQSDGSYKLYIWDGSKDGNAIGDCYSNSASGGTIGPCKEGFMLEKLVCYTYLCS
ncbi:hypothetical protein TrVFT333_002472 [Trichoderma virens FT-333]|nr:hypothetical protein TrVFT333_002472 [Trichoderma virens FT-333]